MIHNKPATEYSTVRSMQIESPTNRLTGFVQSQRHFYQNLVFRIIENTGPRYKNRSAPERGIFVLLRFIRESFKNLCL